MNEIEELKALIKRYIKTVEDLEGYTFISDMNAADERKLNEIYNEEK